MAANVDERQGRALLAHALSMVEAMARERAAVAQQMGSQEGADGQQVPSWPQQGGVQADGHLAVNDTACGAGSSVASHHPALTVGTCEEHPGGQGDAAMTAGPSLPFLPSFPSCIHGSWGGQPDLTLFAGGWVNDGVHGCFGNSSSLGVLPYVLY